MAWWEKTTLVWEGTEHFQSMGGFPIPPLGRTLPLSQIYFQQQTIWCQMNQNLLNNIEKSITTEWSNISLFHKKHDTTTIWSFKLHKLVCLTLCHRDIGGGSKQDQLYINGPARRKSGLNQLIFPIIGRYKDFYHGFTNFLVYRLASLSTI